MIVHLALLLTALLSPSVAQAQAPEQDTTGRRLAAAAIRIGKLTPPAELVNSHALVRSAWGLAETALRLRAESVPANNVDTAQRGRADLTAAMAPPTPK